MMFRFHRQDGRSILPFSRQDVWTGVFVWLVIAGLCVVVANVIAAAI